MQARNGVEKVETDVADWNLGRTDFRQKRSSGRRDQASWVGGPKRGGLKTLRQTDGRDGTLP